MTRIPNIRPSTYGCLAVGKIIGRVRKECPRIASPAVTASDDIIRLITSRTDAS